MEVKKRILPQLIKIRVSVVCQYVLYYIPFLFSAYCNKSLLLLNNVSYFQLSEKIFLRIFQTKVRIIKKLLESKCFEFIILFVSLNSSSLLHLHSLHAWEHATVSINILATSVTPYKLSMTEHVLINTYVNNSLEFCDNFVLV